MQTEFRLTVNELKLTYRNVSIYDLLFELMRDCVRNVCKQLNISDLTDSNTIKQDYDGLIHYVTERVDGTDRFKTALTTVDREYVFRILLDLISGRFDAIDNNRLVSNVLRYTNTWSYLCFTGKDLQLVLRLINSGTMTRESIARAADGTTVTRVIVKKAIDALQRCHVDEIISVLNSIEMSAYANNVSLALNSIDRLRVKLTG